MVLIKGTGINSIYDHIFPNGKHYIGQTWQTVKARAAKDGAGYKDQELMWNAISKYGWDTVKTTTICSTTNQQDANFLEQYFIAKFDSTNRSKGYNIQEGGSDGLWSDDAKLRIKGRYYGEN